MTTATEQLGVRPRYDPYKFGLGADPVLQAGTIGWSVTDLDDPIVRALFDDGRFEIIDGVLAKMPPALFRGGECPDNLKFLLVPYLRSKKIPFRFASEVDVQIDQDRLLRADAAGVFGADLQKFDALKFDGDKPDWRDHALAIPPTLIIESVSQGHEKHDWPTKRRWYAEMGVPNYWIVDAFAKRLDCLRLDNGAYVDGGSGVKDDVVSVAAFDGLVLPLKEVWGD
jgi:Uma2 family endonuclease